MGSAAWTFKSLKKLPMECWLFLGVFIMFIAIPWTTVLLKYPHPIDAIKAVGWKTILLANIFSFGWGIANVLCAVGFMRIGVALTNGILGGFGIAVGVTIPMVFKGSGLFNKAPGLASEAGAIVLSGVALMIVGVILASYAGHLRDRNHNNKPNEFLTSIALVVLGGILSSGPVFVNAYSQEAVNNAFLAQRAGNINASLAVWALGMFAGALVNLVYCSYLMAKNRTWNRLFSCGKELGLPVSSSLQGILGFIMLSIGSAKIGALGASVGWGIYQAMQILGGQSIGFLWGEWKGSDAKPRRVMVAAIGLLIFASAVLALGNSKSPH